jgi:hypothetical protein
LIAARSVIAVEQSQLASMLRAQYADAYNEVIVGASDWNARLPEALAAFVVGRGGSVDDARSHQAAFLRAFPARTAAQHPVLAMDIGADPAFWYA